MLLGAEGGSSRFYYIFIAVPAAEIPVEILSERQQTAGRSAIYRFAGVGVLYPISLSLCMPVSGIVGPSLVCACWVFRLAGSRSTFYLYLRIKSLTVKPKGQAGRPAVAPLVVESAPRLGCR